MMQMQEGKVYYVTVVDIKKTQKQVSTQRYGMTRRYDITVQDKDGNKALCEYLSPTEDQDVFVLGVFQYVKCVVLSPKQHTPEIEPSEPPTTPTGVDAILHMTEDQANRRSANISGQSPTFALAYAKDLLVAEIGNRPPGSAVTDDDMRRLFERATEFNNWMIDKLEERK